MASLVSALRAEVLVATRVSLDTTWASGRPFNNPFARLYWVISGGGAIRHHDREFRLRPHRLYLIPANTTSWYHCPRRMVKDYAHFTSDVLGRADWLEQLGCPFEVEPDDPKHIQALWNRLIRVFNSDSPGRSLESDGLLRQLLTPFLSAVPAIQNDLSQQQARFESVLAYIESHLTEKLTLTELAELVHLQPTYFSNLFCAVMGSPPLQYIRRRRIEQAQAMLWYESAPIKDVAQQLGFADVYHFSRAFTRVAGLGPAAFRRQKRLPLP
jgi:AraC family transcriptional regulator of arabinose operon